PDWINFYHFLGKILVIKQDFSQAALVYQQAIKLKPESGELYALLGETLVNLERLDLAAKCYQRAIQISPQKSGNYRCLGDIYRQQNSLEQAVIYYEQAIAIAPQNPWPYIHLSETLIAQNKFEEANKTCKQSLKFNHGKKAGIYRRVSNLQLKIGSVDDALNTYQKAVKLNPNHADKIFEQLGSKMKENATA
ncbi:MAG: tetratricopeptide repeat protein, partial [Cyanobacteria bacterium J06600_6]